MSRRAITDEDRIKSFLATADLPTLNRFRELADFAIMAKGGPPPKAPRAARKAKDKGQTHPLAGVTA